MLRGVVLCIGSCAFFVFLALALARHDVPPGFRFAWRIARPWLLCASVHALALRSLSPPRCLACSATVLNYWHLFQAPASQQLHLVSWKPFSALGPFVRCRLFLGPAARLFRPRLLRWSPAWFPWSLYVCIAMALRNHSPLLLGLQIREMGIDHHCKKCYKKCWFGRPSKQFLESIVWEFAPQG